MDDVIATGLNNRLKFESLENAVVLAPHWFKLAYFAAIYRRAAVYR